MAASSSDTLAAAVTLLDEQRRAEYERLVSAASKLVADGNNLAKAVKHSKKAIELMPSVPAAYQVLGDAHEAMGAPGLAAQAFIACMDRAEADEAVDKRIWADAASHAYALLVTAGLEHIAAASIARPGLVLSVSGFLHLRTRYSRCQRGCWHLILINQY